MSGNTFTACTLNKFKENERLDIKSQIPNGPGNINIRNNFKNVR